MDGWITIGTKLNTNKFDKQVAELDRKIQKEEKKNLEIEAELKGVREEKAKYEELKREAQSYQAVIDKIRQTQSARTAQGLKPLELTEDAQKIVDRYNQLQGILYDNKSAMQKLNSEENKLLNKQKEINSKVEDYKAKIDTINVERIGKGFNQVGNNIENITKKVSRLVLSIFGIRSAIMIIRRASSDLASYDQEYANQLEYIRYVLAQAIAPILRAIVQLAMTLMSYINAIAQAWFGVNLFANGSVESFKRMKNQAQGVGDAVGGVNKAVKEMKKQLAGFDEINMLTSDAEGGVGAGAGGVGTNLADLGNLPDLSKIQGKVPEWLKWIVDHKDEILSALAGIAGAILAFKVADFLKSLGLISSGLSAIKGLGIGLMISSIVYGIKSLLEYLKNPSWENFGKIIQSIGGFVLGLGLAISSLPVAVAGAVVLIVGTIVKYWEDIRKFLQGGIDWLTGKTDWVRDHFGLVGETIYKYFIDRLQGILDWFNMLFTNIKQIFDGIIQFIKGVFTGNWKMAFEGLGKIVSGIFNIILNTIVDTFNNIVSKIKLKIDFIKSLFKGVIDTISGWFNKMGVKIPEAIGQKFKSIINSILAGVENFLNKPINAINDFISTINSIPGVEVGYLNSIKLGRLRVGGIVNMPNRGTMIGGAIGGESRSGRCYSSYR